MKYKIAVVILAGGKGSRLKGKTIKPLYPLLQEPAIFYVLNSIKCLNLKTYVVCSSSVESYLKEYFPNVELVKQNDGGYGTSWALKSTENILSFYDKVIVLQSDDPLLDESYILKMKKKLSSPYNYIGGKISKLKMPSSDMLVVNKENLQSIDKDGSYINIGRYIFNCKELIHYLARQNHSDSEYKLTEIINTMLSDNHVFKIIKEDKEFINMNTVNEVIKVEEILAKRINQKHIENGVYIEFKDFTRIGPKVKIESGVRLEGTNKIYGDSTLKENCTINNSTIINSSIGCAGNILSSLIEDAIIKEDVEVGPFSHLRKGTILDAEVYIGNFCEIKKTHLSRKTKVKHLSYLGNCDTKENVNIGCGTTTANYDGKTKHQTTIGKDVFIGCNSTLIAPLNIGDNSVIAGGSVITVDVPKNTLSFGRSRQTNYIGRAKK